MCSDRGQGNRRAIKFYRHMHAASHQHDRKLHPGRKLLLLMCDVWFPKLSPFFLRRRVWMQKKMQAFCLHPVVLEIILHLRRLTNILFILHFLTICLKTEMRLIAKKFSIETYEKEKYFANKILVFLCASVSLRLYY